MNNNYGIDIGTTFITIFNKNRDKIEKRVRHNGKIIEILKDFIGKIDQNSTLTLTGKGVEKVAKENNIPFVEEAVALSAFLYEKTFFENGYVVDIGGSSLAMYKVFNKDITDISKNALCAAGTGLFLEEQAERLSINLENFELTDIDNPPHIASRCTVFAKSDLIHHQQEGRTIKEMWSGLCRALSVSAINTLFRGKTIDKPLLLIGGVSLNKEVLKWLKKDIPNLQLIVDKDSEAIISKGASLIKGVSISKIDLSLLKGVKNKTKNPPLTIKKSRYPKFVDPTIDNLKNEIRVYSKWSGKKQFHLGVDIGSTSTKMVLLDSKSYKPVVDIYRKTAGEPIEATKKMLKGLYSTFKADNIEIISFGTTGSGRRLIGELFKADSIVNEITAHGKGTAFNYPDVETIFEIGGQDAKYIKLKNGYVSDVNMNYVCAAGTGSFIEEQARKLEIPLFKIGDLTKDIVPPVTSDRCTVFMEQDVRALLKDQFSKNETIGAVLYSIIQNYLNRVVGNREISKDKIFFQGATARNRGLVAAIENLLDVEVVVSPYCHVMGAIGAALISAEAIEKGSKTKFLGESSINLNAKVDIEICKLCRNYCRINVVETESKERITWGYLCGREEGESYKNIETYLPFKDRKKWFNKKDKVENSVETIYIPYSLSNLTYYPLWSSFFKKLNIDVKLSSSSTTPDIKKKGIKLASEDFCFPVKASIGHIIKLVEEDRYIFDPYFIADREKIDTAISFYCPYVESNPSIIKSSLKRDGLSIEKYLTPVLDFRSPIDRNGIEIFKILSKEFNIKKRYVVKYFKESYLEWEKSNKQLIDRGENYLEKFQKGDKPIFVIIGRPYNIHDKGINLGIPEIVASMGYPVIPIDMLNLDDEIKNLKEGNYFNLFWQYGQKIIAAIKRVAKMDNVFPIYLSNFNCGPDSFILSFAEEEIQNKPMLILELDEHDSIGGYQTRIEAFIDVVNQYKLSNSKFDISKKIPEIYRYDRESKTEGTIWFPPMHPSTPLLASLFRGHGYKSEVLDFETKESFLMGKKHVRGSECLPMILTLGAVLKQYPEMKTGKHTLFMPTSEGPCRFGQYNLLERFVFEKERMKNIDILSPSSINSYQGLNESLRRGMMNTILTMDILLKMVTKVRPYEKNRGDSDQLFKTALKEIGAGLEKGDKPINYIKDFAKRFNSIPIYSGKKPLVGIVGEFYIRCNSYGNGNLIDVIEKNGGEAWLAPIHEWILYTANIQSYMVKKEKFSLFSAGESLIKNLYLFKVEHDYYKAASKLLYNREEPDIKDVIKKGEKYLPKDFVGEALLTIGRALKFVDQGVDMVVNASPFGCMHGTISSSIFNEIKQSVKIPIISQFYDGDIDINDKVSSILQMINHTVKKKVEFKR